MNPADVLILPGYGDSGPEHWQSLWEAAHGYTRVVQDDWLEPTRAAWVETLDAAVAAASGPVVLVAHSLACALVAHFAARAAGRVAGALLVAPADVESADHTPDEVRSFAPLPQERLPFATIVVASSDDPFVDLPRARHFADAWGARLVEVGAAGHVNADTGFGPWPEGHVLLASLLR